MVSFYGMYARSVSNDFHTDGFTQIPNVVSTLYGFAEDIQATVAAGWPIIHNDIAPR